MDCLELHEHIIASERVWGIGHAAIRTSRLELPTSTDDADAVEVVRTTQQEIDDIVTPLL